MLPGLLGFIVVSFLPLVPIGASNNLHQLALLDLLLVTLMLLCCRKVPPTKRATLLSAAAFATGVSVALFNVSFAMSDAMHRLLPVSADRQDFQLTVLIAGLPEKRRSQFGEYQRVVVDVLSLERVDGIASADVVPRRARINIYQPLPDGLAMGDVWRWQVRLKRPRGNANPGGRDAVRAALATGIDAMGYLREPTLATLLQRGQLDLLERWRMQVVTQLDRRLANTSSAAILRAILVGDRRYLSDEQWTLFRVTGTSHLMAISGLHIGIAASVAYAVCWLVCTLFPVIALRQPRQVVAAFAAAPVASYYAVLAGFSLPTVRALLMVFAVLLVVAQRSRWNRLTGLLLAMALILLLDPLAVLGAGFWLSFGAVLVLMLALAPRGGMQEGARSGQDAFSVWRQRGLGAWQFLRVLIAAQVAILLGFSLAASTLVGELSFLSPIANAIAIPAMGYLVVPLGLLAMVLLPLVPALSVALLGVAEWSIAQLLEFLQCLAALEWPAGDGLSLYAPVFVALLLVSNLVLLRGPRAPGFVLALALWVLVVLPVRAPGFIESGSIVYSDAVGSVERLGEFLVYQLDVGQGTAVLIRTHRHVLLYDTGPAYTAVRSAGDAIVLPFLAALGIRDIDAVVLSHGDSDHVGGAVPLALAFPYAKWYAGTPVTEGGESASVPLGKNRRGRSTDVDLHGQIAQRVRACRRGHSWQWDGVNFEFLYPDGVPASRSRNDHSCVLRVSAVPEYRQDESSTAQGSVLLTGDIGRKAEAWLLESGAAVEADIVLVPHHGSKTSSRVAFVEAVKPGWALVSAGYRNRYRHPHPDVVRRYDKVGANILQSAAFGAVALRYRRGRWEGPFCHRYAPRYFWQNVDNTGVCAGAL